MKILPKNYFFLDVKRKNGFDIYFFKKNYAHSSDKK